MNSRLQFRIDGMDCAEEVAMLKKALKNLVQSEQDLQFDLLNAKLTITPLNTAITEQQLLSAIATSGLKATPWQQHLKRLTESSSPWQRFGRGLLVLLSLLLLIAGVVLHALRHNVADALMGDYSSQHHIPLVAAIFYLLSIVCSAWFVAPKAWLALRRLRPDINLLMIIAVIGALLIQQWLEAAMVTLLFAIAQLLEAWSVGKARQAVKALLTITPETAHVKTCCGNIKEALAGDIKVGTEIIIRPGEKIPLDAKIVAGETHVDQAPITGESRLVSKQVGSLVYAGTINSEGVITAKVTQPSDNTLFAQTIRQVEQAQANKARSELWVEKFAKYYTPLMMLLAALVMVVPPLFTSAVWLPWIYEGLVVLVIACPCALVISTPVSIIAGLSAAARVGVLIKGGSYLETLAQLKVVAFDKTGTITQGRPKVERVITFESFSETDILQLAASLESHSNHPLAHAILQQAKAQNIPLLTATELKTAKGKGIKGVIDEKPYWIGSHRFLHEKLNANEEPEGLHQLLAKLEDEGHSLVVLGQGESICGLISIADQLRPESENVVSNLKQLDLQTALLTGDNKGTTNAIATGCAFDQVHAELLPTDKMQQIHKLRQQFGPVAMVGDGINDAPALASADIGIAMGALGSDDAIETADVALMTDSITKVPWLIHHSKRVLRTIKTNITFALGLKLIFILLAFAKLATLWMAIAADTGASLLVIFYSLRLLSVKQGLQTPPKTQ